MWRRREFHWNPFAHQAPAAHPNHDPTSLWRSTHGWNQSGTCRIGGLGDWGIGVMKNQTQYIPRISRMTISYHFYNTRGIWGNFQVGCGSRSTEKIGFHHIRHHQATNNKVAASEARTVAWWHLSPSEAYHHGWKPPWPIGSPSTRDPYLHLPTVERRQIQPYPRVPGSPGCEVGISHLLGQPVHLWRCHDLGQAWWFVDLIPCEGLIFRRF